MKYSFMCKDLQELLSRLNKGVEEKEQLAMISHFEGNIHITKDYHDHYVFSIIKKMVEYRQTDGLKEFLTTIVEPNKKIISQCDSFDVSRIVVHILKEIEDTQKNKKLTHYQTNIDIFELLKPLLNDCEFEFSKVISTIFFYPSKLINVKEDCLKFMIAHKSFNKEDRERLLNNLTSEGEESVLLFKRLEKEFLFKKLNEKLPNNLSSDKKVKL